MIAPDPENVAAAIRTALAERGPGKTVCPSEIARRVAGESGDWRGQMTGVHLAVDAMVGAGEIALSWKGRTMPARQGPYRIGIPE